MFIAMTIRNNDANDLTIFEAAKGLIIVEDSANRRFNFNKAEAIKLRNFLNAQIRAIELQEKE